MKELEQALKGRHTIAWGQRAKRVQPQVRNRSFSYRSAVSTTYKSVAILLYVVLSGLAYQW
jgi:hypothetical protein